MMYLDRVKERVQELHLLAQNVVWPCTEQEIEQLEEWLNIELPAAYKEFLLWMGHRAGQLFADASCNYWDLEGNQTLAVEILHENSFPTSLPKDAFVFLINQGYKFYFFRLSEGADPPVYYYEELMQEPAFPSVCEHFSEYLEQRVEEHANFLKRSKARIAELQAEREKRETERKTRGAES